MGVVSPYTLIRAISLFHITAAWFFLAAPRTIVDQNVVFMLGESMRLVRKSPLTKSPNHNERASTLTISVQPQITTMDKPSEASAFIAILLAFFGLSDLTAASLDALPALEYWLANVPVRLSVLFAVTAYSYLFKDDGMLGPAGGPGRYLCNALVFTWGFMELMVWFWVSLGELFMMGDGIGS